MIRKRFWITGDGRLGRRWVLAALTSAFACAILLCGARAFAQGGLDENMPPSNSNVANDVANDNLDRVAATESQIAEVLEKNPGLMVELKRWVAKDATDHGQIVQDDDLTDSAIMARLVQDQKFRATATRLLQRFGYLLPKVNPDSPVGQAQAALLQERIRQLVSNDRTRAVEAKCSEEANSKDRASDADCAKQQPASGERTSTGNPTAKPAQDRDLNDLLNNPGASTNGLNEQLVRSGTGSLGENDDGDSRLMRSPRVTADGSLASGGSAASLTGLSSNSDLTGGTNLALMASSGMLPSSIDPFAPPADLPQPPQPPVATSSPVSDASVGANSPDFEDVGPGGPSAMTQHRSPYSDIPSVYDMFTSAASFSGPVKRFGEQIFRDVPKSSTTLPIDFPASPDYVVGPGDGLAINLWGGVSQRLVRTVDSEGRVALPEVGPLEVDGQSLAQVQQAVQSALRTQFRDVSADVSLSRLRTVRIYVVGDVTHPGPYDVSSLSTPLNALLAAAGPTAGGSFRIVEHYRGDVLVQSVDLYDLLLRGVRTGIQRLEPGDTLLVPPMGPQVRIEGMVRRPAIYELHGETNLAQALDLAGGILPTAALGQIEVQRLEAHEKKTMLSLDVSGTTNPAEIEAKLAAFQVRDRDEIHIFPIATFNQDAVYLQGHVVRAGRYAYKPGMKLTDLISSYSDLLPEPSTSYAEIIRLNAPDYHPSVESFDLAAALSNPAAAPEIKPLDTVRIFSRFDFENAPVVSVSGAVRNPGTFQTSGEIRVRDAVALSGGVTPDASMDAAQIIRMMPDSSLTVVSIRLKEALAGDPAYNVLVQPRDRLLIQKNIQRTDPPSVLIGGEVANPGRYALTQSLRVSDLVRVAGGFKRSAEVDVADLTQFVISNDASPTATHVNVNLTAAMAGDIKQDFALHDGDVLTIREVPGWNVLQASITVQGEVKHPGRYGIRPGERLSSVLERAGGFAPEAYPYGALLERPQVRELEAKERDALILRVKDAQDGLELLPEGDAQQKAAKATALQQWQGTLEELSSHPPIGRVTMRLGANVDRWKGTAADIEVHSGDTLLIPQKPGYVLVTGQVFNATAVAYRPGRSAEWYLSQAGGPTQTGNKKAIFVVRADGSVLGERKGLLAGDSLNAALQPGDTVVVPEKALGGTVQWQNLLLSAQVASSIASTLFIALHY